MKTIRKLDSTGDTAITFDDTATTAAARAEAKALFDRVSRQGGAAFSVNRTGGQPDQKITRFDQIEDWAETILVPRVVGG